MADTVATNQAYFNKIAADYDARFSQGLGQLEDAIRASADFIGAKPGGRLLDYACGTGLLSRSFMPPIGQCVGIDITANMVEAYNAKARNEGLYPNARQAHVGNLVLPADPSPATFSGPEFFDFDVAGVGAGFHHFDDCDLAARRLAERLRPGGVLFILDFVVEDELAGVGDKSTHGVTRHGFSETQIRNMFEAAGVGAEFVFKELEKPIVFKKGTDGPEMKKRVFLARGTKA